MMSAHDISGAALNRYTRIAIFPQWAIAAFIILNLCTGFFIESWLHGTPVEGPPPQANWASLVLHASSGLTVLALTVVRVAWRLLNDPPPPPADRKPWERHAAHGAHFLLYAAMVLLPLTGWAILSAHPPPGSRGATAVAAPPGVAPPSAAPQHHLHEQFAEWHRTGGWLLLGLLILHVLGALKHQFVDGQSGLARMAIGRRLPGRAPPPNSCS